MSTDIGKGDRVRYIGGMQHQCYWSCKCIWPFPAGSIFTVSGLSISPRLGIPCLSFVGVKVGRHRSFAAKHFVKIGPERDIEQWLDQKTDFEGPKRLKVLT